MGLSPIEGLYLAACRARRGVSGRHASSQNERSFKQNPDTDQVAIGSASLAKYPRGGMNREGAQQFQVTNLMITDGE